VSSCAEARLVPDLSVGVAPRHVRTAFGDTNKNGGHTCRITHRPLTVSKRKRSISFLVDGPAHGGQGGPPGGGGKQSENTHVSAIVKTSYALSHQGSRRGGGTEFGIKVASNGHSISVNASASVPISQLWAGVGISKDVGSEGTRHTCALKC
jgi:hypothetical protein